MRKIHLFSVLAIFLLILSACSSPPANSEVIENDPPTEEPSPPPVVETSTDLPVAAPTETPIQPAVATIPPVLDYPSPDPGTVALDFVAEMCKATWSNSTTFFNCPGASGEGNSISRVDSPTLSNGQQANQPALLSVPVQHNGVFGRYPSVTIYPGDQIRALLACKEPDKECTAEFSIEYYINGSYKGYPNAIFQTPVSVGVDGYYELVVPLNALAGETVDIVLAVREKGVQNSAQALWIAPYLYRDPNATPVSPAATTSPGQNPTPTEDNEDKTPGVISGWVDYTGAPGGVSNGQAMTVMFFHQEDATWWWVQTGTNNPYFLMTMPPGPYVVTAYTSTTSAGYTGGGQTCGSGLAVVNLDPNGEESNIVITDWCNPGYWPARPGAAPLP